MKTVKIMDLAEQYSALAGKITVSVVPEENILGKAIMAGNLAYESTEVSEDDQKRYEDLSAQLEKLAESSASQEAVAMFAQDYQAVDFSDPVKASVTINAINARVAAKTAELQALLDAQVGDLSSELSAITDAKRLAARDAFAEALGFSEGTTRHVGQNRVWQGVHFTAAYSKGLPVLYDAGNKRIAFYVDKKWVKHDLEIESATMLKRLHRNTADGEGNPRELEAVLEFFSNSPKQGEYDASGYVWNCGGSADVFEVRPYRDDLTDSEKRHSSKEITKRYGWPWK